MVRRRTWEMWEIPTLKIEKRYVQKFKFQNDFGILVRRPCLAKNEISRSTSRLLWRQKREPILLNTSHKRQKMFHNIQSYVLHLSLNHHVYRPRHHMPPRNSTRIHARYAFCIFTGQLTWMKQKWPIYLHTWLVVCDYYWSNNTASSDDFVSVNIWMNVECSG